MGLLDLFKRSAQSDSAPERAREPDSPSLEEYARMRVEVTTAQEGRFLFVAKLMYPRGDSAELHQYSETVLPREEGEEPPEPLPVKIRGYSDHARKAVYLEGSILPQPRSVWKVEGLRLVKLGNDRAFFRLDTDLPASMITFTGLGAGERDCVMKNISVGGACVAAESVLHMGDKFLMKVKLLEERPVSAMMCQVVRITEREKGLVEYGCQFLELTEEDQDRIAQSIFTAQKKQRGAY